MLPPVVTDTFLRHHLVSTDSRNVPPQAIFFALSGANFDGNQYAGKALAAGASLAVVSDPAVMVPGDGRYVLVPDTLLALQDFARWYRRTLKVPVLGITGTNGKTTTKELVNAVMSTDRRVHATSGNLNNHIGVPLTVLSCPADIDFLILEMGANKPGDIRELVEIGEPSHTLITNIGYAHLERFKDVEGVRRTKGEIFDWIRAAGGTGFVNRNDARVASVAEGMQHVVSFGTPDSDYFIEQLDEMPDHMHVRVRMARKGESHVFRANLIGQHNAENVLVAVAVGDTFRVPLEKIQAGLAGYHPKINRTELLQGPGFRLLLDAYNANPSSMAAALRAVGRQAHTRLALVLGDMFELGEESARLHLELVDLVRELHPSATLIGVGHEMAKAVAARQHGHGFESVEAAGAAVKALVEGADYLLIKGSRGMALERLLPALGVERAGKAH